MTLIITGPACDCLHLRQQIPKLAVIHFHPVIKVWLDAPIGIVAEFFVVCEKFDVFFAQAFNLFVDSVAGGG
jgi:hypothetical protein